MSEEPRMLKQQAVDEIFSIWNFLFAYDGGDEQECSSYPKIYFVISEK
jgi:hypothetical protein